MATQKKATGGKSGGTSAGKASSKPAGKSAKSSGSASGRSTTKKTAVSRPAHRPPNMEAVRREKERRRYNRLMIGGLICAFLAFLGFLGYFNTDAAFLGLFSALTHGLIGYGAWLMPIMLVLCTWLLVTGRKKRVCLRVVCALLTPAVFGGIRHAIHSSSEYPKAFVATVQLLWQKGQIPESGGVLSGLMAIGLSSAVSKVGAVILLIVVLLLCVLGISRLTPADIADFIRTRAEERAQRLAELDELYALEDDEDFYDDLSAEVSPPELERKQKKEKRRAAETGGRRLSGDGKLEKTLPELHEPSPRRLTAEIDIPIDAEGERVKSVPPAEVPPTPSQEEDPAVGIFRRLEKGKRVKKAAPEIPVPVAEEEPEPDLEFSHDPELVRSAVAQAEEEILRSAQERAASMAVPPPQFEITREEAVAKVSSKQAAAAAQEVAVQAAAALDVDVPAYQYPSVALLAKPSAESPHNKENLSLTEERLVDTIESFGIEAHLKNVTCGPTVARFELELDRGVKLSKLTNLADDIALALGVSGVRIAPVPGQMSMVGIEVPNREPSPVPIRAVIDSDAFTKQKSKVAFAVGKDISGKCVVGNISKLPHLLIAGTTGSGKSVCINSLLISLLYKATPQEVRLIMVDPKKVELGIYNNIPHLLIPVVTEPKKAAGALQWAVVEMMKRYTEFSEVGVRKLDEYNKLAADDPDREVMPSIVVVIDELADLMIVAAKEVEESICRIAQLGRAAGMHLVVATQRPSADVITGLMKANIPSRIAFSVASSMESRIILDQTGAEKLVGKGDMLYAPIGSGKPQRVQGCLISDEEVSAVVEFVKSSGEAMYDEDVINEVNTNAANTKGAKGSAAPETTAAGDFDEMLPSAVDVFLEIGQASVSMLQRRLKLGYSRAARVVDQMEELGLVGPFEGSKPRQLKITKEEWVTRRAELTGQEPEPPILPEQPPFDTGDEDEDALE